MRHALYRHFDAEGGLLYVGTTLSPLHRQRRHLATSDWRDEIAAITIERFPSQSTARDAEALAIVRESPKYNRTYAQTTCRRGNEIPTSESESPEFAKRLIDSVGGNRKFATALGIGSETWAVQRVSNWKRRGIPLSMHWKYRAAIDPLIDVMKRSPSDAS